MRESRTYGSVRGARDETRVPTATAIHTQLTAEGANPSTNPIGAAGSQLFITHLAGPPREIPPGPRSVGIEEHSDHAKKMLTAASAFLTSIPDNSAWTAPGGFHLREVLRGIPVLISDLQAEMTDTLQAPAESMAAWRVA